MWHDRTWTASARRANSIPSRRCGQSQSASSGFETQGNEYKERTNNAVPKNKFPTRMNFGEAKELRQWRCHPQPSATTEKPVIRRDRARSKRMPNFWLRTHKRDMLHTQIKFREHLSISDSSISACLSLAVSTERSFGRRSWIGGIGAACSPKHIRGFAIRKCCTGCSPHTKILIEGGCTFEHVVHIS